MDGWWIDLLDADPVPWLLASDEPAARLVTLTRVLGRADDDPEVVATRAAVIADPATEDLLGRLGDWEAGDAIGGHNSPRYLPNLLVLLDEMGVRRADDPRIETVLQAMLRHQAGDGRGLHRRGRRPSCRGHAHHPQPAQDRGDHHQCRDDADSR